MMMDHDPEGESFFWWGHAFGGIDSRVSVVGFSLSCVIPDVSTYLPTYLLMSTYGHTRTRTRWLWEWTGRFLDTPASQVGQSSHVSRVELVESSHNQRL